MEKLKLFLITFLSLIHLNYLTQSPQFFNYQAVAHNNNGNVIQNQSLNVIITIISDSATGSTAYEETHNSIMTNSYGLFNLKIGEGSVNSGSFSSINWKSKKHFLKIQIDAGNGYEFLGINQFAAVPYAKVAERVITPDLSSLVDHTPFDGYFTYYNEIGLSSTVIYGWKSDGVDTYSTIPGNVGIGAITPSSKLDVGGTLTLSNSTSEINTANTGTANMLPIAYGKVDSAGNLGANSGNISATWNATSGVYEITITGQNYNSQDYITQVTLIGGVSGSVDEVFTNAANGNLIVILKNNVGVATTSAFSFVTFKP